jgi:two-component system chemotaxis response regulator CheB
VSGRQPPVGVRVLVVDDSTTYRRVVRMLLGSDDAVVVVEEAANGAEALESISQHLPDVVLLDVEMPVLDGLATLRRIRGRWPRLPVLMLSSLTTSGAAVTVEALAAGAADFVAKPSGLAGKEARAALRHDLLTKLKAICAAALLPGVPAGRPPGGPRPGTGASAPEERRAAGPAARGAPSVVVVGASTGGPNALASVIAALPADFPVPVVVVQHMPASFTSLLAERLDRCSQVAVVEAAEPAPLSPGRVYLARGGRHLQVARCSGRPWAVPLDAAPENSCKPAVDVLFRSAAAVGGAGVLGVVLTGMGSDGCLGSRAVVQAGGSVFVQDQATSVVWGMPGAVARAGLAERVLPLDEIAAALIERATCSRWSLADGTAGMASPAAPAPVAAPDEMRGVPEAAVADLAARGHPAASAAGGGRRR